MAALFRVTDPLEREAIKALTTHKGWDILVKAAGDARDHFYANFAKGLARQAAPVDQREIDYKRGFWRGVLWALKVFPTLTAADFDKAVAEALKESDELARRS